MSLESAKSFIKKLQDDEEFARLFFACSDPEGRKIFIKEKGFDFTKEEIDESTIGIDISGGRCCGKTCERDGHKENCRRISNPEEAPYWDT